MHQNPYANSPLVVALRKKSYYKAWRCTRLLSTAGSFLLLLLLALSRQRTRSIMQHRRCRSLDQEPLQSSGLLFRAVSGRADAGNTYGNERLVGASHERLEPAVLSISMCLNTLPLLLPERPGIPEQRLDGRTELLDSRASAHQNGSPFPAGRLIFSCPRSPRSAWCELHGLRQSPQRGELQAQASRRFCGNRLRGTLLLETTRPPAWSWEPGKAQRLVTALKADESSPVLKLPALKRSKAAIQHLILRQDWATTALQHCATETHHGPAQSLSAH